jgi:hypothetical protein
LGILALEKNLKKFVEPIRKARINHSNAERKNIVSMSCSKTASSYAK